jgi:phosphate-selective porin OprO/OprP
MIKILTITVVAYTLTINSSATLPQFDQSFDARISLLESRVISVSTAEKNQLLKAFETAKLSGRLHVDSKFYNENNTLGDAKQDGIDIGRARLGIKGNLSKNFGYKFENDFAKNASKIKDAYISYDGIKNSQFKIGQFKQPFSLAKLTSSNNITFINRSTAISDIPSRSVGLQGLTYGDNWQVTTGIFGQLTGNENRSDDSTYSATIRTSYSPVNFDGKLIHLGLSAVMISADRNTVSTEDGNIVADSIDKENIYGAEFVLGLNSLSLQAEYIINDTVYDKSATGSNIITTNKEAIYKSYYFQASYILTGENRIYKTKSGIFNGIKVKNSVDNGGIGAWELAARISQNNKNYDDQSTAIIGGKTNDITFGANWYLNNNTRLMANYIVSSVDNRTNSDKKYDAFMIRAQLNF